MTVHELELHENPVAAVYAAAGATLEALGEPVLDATIADIVGTAAPNLQRSIQRGASGTAATWLFGDGAGAGLNPWRASRGLPPLALVTVPDGTVVVDALVARTAFQSIPLAE